MVAQTTVDESRAELLRSGGDLEPPRREAASLGHEITERFDASRDSREPEDVWVALTVADEQDAVTGGDEARCENLQRQLQGV